MEKIDLLKTLYAIEKASNGFDLNSLTADVFTEPKTGSCLFKVADSLLSNVGLFFKNVYRNEKQWESYSDDAVKELSVTSEIEVSEDIFRDTAKFLKSKGVVSYVGVSPEFIDREFLTNLEKTRAEWDYKQLIDCPLRDLTIEKTDTDFKTLLALIGYPIELAQDIYEHYKVGKQYNLAAFKDFKWENNRLIIPLSDADKYDLSKNCKDTIEAIVISANPYDFFFCSYGNAFQSCFALNSTGSSYFSGYVPKSMTGEAFMIYTTNGKTVDVSMTQGHKMQIPQMLSRSWAYLDTKRHLLIDKPYGNYQAYTFAGEFLEKKFKAGYYYNKDRATRKIYNGGAKMAELRQKYSLPAYYDSLKFKEDSVTFRYAAGDSGLGGSFNIAFKSEHKARSFTDFASRVKKVSTIDFSKKHIITDDGTLTVEQRCPVTNFLIDSSMTQHTVAKYFPCVSKKSLYLTYVDGYLGWTAKVLDNPVRDCILAEDDSVPAISDGTLYVPRFGTIGMSKCMNLKALKDFLKGAIKKSVYDVVLLRVVENDKVTFQSFRNNKGGSDESR